MSTSTSTKSGTSTIGTYADGQGIAHQVLVVQTEEQTWEILDAASRHKPALIDRLAGEGENTGTAEALAQDYLAAQSRAGLSRG